MENNLKEQSTTSARITVIDALRGFALLGVVLVHMQQHYSYQSLGPFAPHESFFSEWNESVTWLTRNVLMGRFINIFAFLFGMSFFIQMDSAARKGIRFGGRFFWRMVILFVIGLVGNAFYSGDILSIYAVFGVILLFLNRFKNWVLLLIAALLLMGTPKMLMQGYEQIKTSFQTEEVRAVPMETPAQQVEQENPGLKHATFASAVEYNFTDRMEWKLNFQFVRANRGYVTLAVFLLGLVIGRIRFFQTVHLHRKRNWILLGVFALAWWVSQELLPVLPKEGTFWSYAGQTWKDVNVMLLSAVFTMAFIVLYQLPVIGKGLEILAPYGRMGLTNYLSQSVIGALLFATWAGGFTFGSWQAADLLMLGLLVYAAQIVFSKIWLHYFLYGPIEWLWRSATYCKWQPLWKK